MTQVEVSSNCMKGITIVHVGKRNFRVPTASLPAGSTLHRDIYVRPYNITETENEDNKEITLELNVPRSLYGAIIGRGGNNVKQLRNETKTRISFPFKGPATIIGTKDGVEMAKKRIEDIIKSYNYKVEDEKKDVKKDVELIRESINIPQPLYKLIIERVVEIMNETKTKITLQTIIIQGRKDGVEKAKMQIENIIKLNNYDEKKEVVELTKKSIDEEKIIIKLDIPQFLYGLIIGKGGNTVRRIKYETNTDVTLQNENPVIIQGTKDGVEMAKIRIEDIIKSYNQENEKSALNNTKIEKDDVKLTRESINEENVIIKLDIPQFLYGLIIGKGGNTISKIMYDTKTKVTIQNENPVTIQGTKDGVEMAKIQIENIILSQPTHFISLPLIDSNLQRKVETFKSDVLNLNIRDIDRSIFTNSFSLHITIGVLSLYKREDIEGAVQLLKSLSTEINNLIGTRTLVSNLTGLAVMENDPGKAHVLYAKVEEQEDLKTLGEYLIKKFTEAGYLMKDGPLKLHVTLINTKYRKNEYSVSNHYNNYNRYRESYNRYPFNANQILGQFSSIEFGFNRIESIHISKIGEYDQNGRHYSEGSIKLP